MNKIRSRQERRISAFLGIALGIALVVLTRRFGLNDRSPRTDSYFIDDTGFLRDLPPVDSLPLVIAAACAFLGSAMYFLHRAFRIDGVRLYAPSGLAMLALGIAAGTGSGSAALLTLKSGWFAGIEGFFLVAIATLLVLSAIALVCGIGYRTLRWFGAIGSQAVHSVPSLPGASAAAKFKRYLLADSSAEWR